MTKLKRNLALAAVAALGGGWAGVATNRLTKQPDSMDSLGAGVWLVAPAAATVALRAAGSGWTGAGLAPRGRSTVAWCGAGAAFHPVVTVGVVAAGRRLGWLDCGNLDLRALTHATVRTLPATLAKNVLEETIWRGFFTSQLDRVGVRPVVADLGVGLLWGLWHLPYYGYFLDADRDMRPVLDVGRAGFSVAGVATITAWAIPYADVFRRSGSIWPTVVLHSVGNSLLNPLLVDGHVRMAPERQVMSSPMVGALAGAAHLVAGLAMRAVRR